MAGLKPDIVMKQLKEQNSHNKPAKEENISNCFQLQTWTQAVWGQDSHLIGQPKFKELRWCSLAEFIWIFIRLIMQLQACTNAAFIPFEALMLV